MINYDIIIVGGGLVGAAFALDIAQKKPTSSIAVLEQREYNIPDFAQYDNKIYAISPQNIEYLNKLKVWPDNDRIGIIKVMDVSGDIKSNILLNSKLSKQLYLAKTVEYHNLQHKLYTKLQGMLNITFIYDKLIQLENTLDYIKLIGERNSYTARLIVGADGANSFIRRQTKIEVSKIDYGYNAVVANFSCEKPHKNVAYQWFKDKGILAYLPLNNNQISIVWATARSQELLAMSDVEFADNVAKASEYKLGKLNIITKAALFPLRLYLIDKIFCNRIVLIGDAAHTIHPLAGQGVNLGFEDAKILAELLAKHQSYQFGDTSILAKFNALRLSNVRKMQLTCHFLRQLFISDNNYLKHVRNYGLNLINTLPIVKKYLIGRAITY